MLFITINSNISSQSFSITEQTKKSWILKEESDIVYSNLTSKKGLLFIEEKDIKIGSKVLYTIYHYNSDGKLINRKNYKTKKAAKIYSTNDSIYFIFTKINKLNKPLKSTKSKKKSLKDILFLYESASIKELEFKKNEAFVNQGLRNNNIINYKNIFDYNNEKKILLNINFHKYIHSRKEYGDIDLKIKANDFLDRQNNYISRFRINLLNSNFKNILFKDLIISNNIGDFQIENYKVDTNKNNIYLLLSTYDRSKKKFFGSKNKINTKYHLIKINKYGVLSKTIDEGIHSIKTINIEFFENQLICAGMYSDTNDNKLNGFFKFEFDKDNLAPQSQSFFKFSKQFITDIKTTYIYNNKTKLVKKLINANYEKFKNLSSNHISIDEEGNCIINIEEYEIFKSGGAPMMGMSTSGLPGSPLLSASMDFNNSSDKKQKGIIIAKISKNNQLIWARNIKNNDLRGSNYLTTTINGLNYIIKKNTPKTHKQYNKNDENDSKNHYLYGISINDFGEIKSQRFFPHKLKNKIELFKMNNKDIYIKEIDKKVFQLGKLKID